MNLLDLIATIAAIEDYDHNRLVEARTDAVRIVIPTIVIWGTM
jgi:hypothetical protein